MFTRLGPLLLAVVLTPSMGSAQDVKLPYVPAGVLAVGMETSQTYQDPTQIDVAMAAARYTSTPYRVDLAGIEYPTLWVSSDPDDSLFSAGREALNRNQFREAAGLFQQLRRDYPESDFVPSAMYWEAFSRYRIGGTDNLRTARELLDQQVERFPNARTHNDALTLATRIDGSLATVGDSRAAQEVYRELQSQECPEGENDVRIAALNALMNSNPERAIPILKRVLERRDPCSTEMRKTALFVIAQQGNGQTTAILMDVVSHDPDPEIRGDAVFWLSQSPSPEVVPLLDSLLRYSSDDEIREKALFALAQQDGTRSLASMRAVIADPTMPTELRSNAIFWLGQNGGEETSTYLRELYQSLEEPELREQVLFAVAQSDDPANGHWLIGIARDQSQPTELRKNALFWAGQSGAGIAELVEMWDQALDLEMKEQLVFVYSQSDSPEALDKLFEIARTETNKELRENAIFWLGQSDDPRVTDFLEQLISN